MSIWRCLRFRNRQTYIFHTHRWLWQHERYLSIWFHFYCEYIFATGNIQQVIISRVNRWRNEYDYMASDASPISNTSQKLYLWRGENSFINLESIKSFAVMPTALLAKFISFFSLYRAGLLWFFFCVFAVQLAAVLIWHAACCCFVYLMFRWIDVTSCLPNQFNLMAALL